MQRCEVPARLVEKLDLFDPLLVESQLGQGDEHAFIVLRLLPQQFFGDSNHDESQNMCTGNLSSPGSTTRRAVKEKGAN